MGREGQETSRFGEPCRTADLKPGHQTVLIRPEENKDTHQILGAMLTSFEVVLDCHATGHTNVLPMNFADADKTAEFGYVQAMHKMGALKAACEADLTTHRTAG